jgi:AcrR family transcriptional regulator
MKAKDPHQNKRQVEAIRAEDHPLSEDQKARKRAQFYEASEPLLVRWGYRKTTVEDICRAAGASKRTFYELFTGKNDLAARLIIHAASEMVDRYQARTVSRESARSRLARFLDEYAAISRERAVFRISLLDRDLLEAFGTLAPELRDSPPFLVLRDILAQGIKTGEFRVMDADFMTRTVFTVLDSTFFLRPALTHTRGPLEDDHLVQQIKEFVVSGFLPERRVP